MSLGRKILLALFGCLLAAPLSAQSTGTVAGRVLEGANQEPLGGVAVSVAQRTAVTGADGRFSIAGVPAGTHTLQATRIGFAAARREITVVAGQTTTVDLSLGSQALLLEEVVAIGYGQRAARDVTGSVEVVGSDEFNTGRVVSPEQLIQGKVAGVQVIDSGEPGGGINLRVRGGTSVTSSSEPLFVVDGVPVEVGGGISAGRNPLNFLNPNDIASVTVLKDAASTAIYGSRGANGVVMIETRTGSGAPQLTYTSSVSRSQITNEPDLLDAAQFRTAVQQYAPENIGKLMDASTDWRGAVQQDATGQEHQLAFAGSGGTMNYRLSLNYLDQAGVVRGTNTERLSAAVNYSHRLFDDHLTLRTNLKGSRAEDQFTPGGVLGAATAFAPTQPIRVSNGSYYEWTEALGPNNPVAELDLVNDRGVTYRSIGSLEAAYRLPFFEALQTTLRLGYDVAKADRAIFSPTNLRSQVENPVCVPGPTGSQVCGTGSLEERNHTQSHTVVDAFATYTRALDWMDSDVEATAGYSYENSRTDYPSFVASGLSNDFLGPNGVPGAVRVLSFLDIQEHRLASYFARFNATFADRFLMTLSVRRDGSSRFGPSTRWGTFPAASVGWRMSDESFLEGYSWLSDLKLRASWGVNGNQEFGNYLSFTTYQIGDNQSQAQFGNTFVTTVRPSAVDPDIKWEETTSYDVGVDFGFLDNRFTGSLDYYFKDTDDLIFNVPVPAGTNLSNFVTTNIGSMRNKGIELALNARVLDQGGDGLRWDASFNAARNTNRLLSINPLAGGVSQILTGGISGGVGNNIQVLKPGYSVNSFFVYRHKRDADGTPLYADADGDGDIDDTDLYVDLNDDGVVNQDDRTPFESPAATWILGHTSNLAFRDFDLGFTLRANLGNYVYNNVASSLGFYDALKGGAPTNLHASVLENGFRKPQYFSDVYVEDASYLRMDNLTLGYTFHQLRQVDEVRVFGTVQNVFTVTDYSGVDPSAGLNGIDNNIYPRSRTFSLGVTLGF